MSDILLKTAERIMQGGIVEDGDSLVIGLSGGGDSVGLFFSLLELKKLVNYELKAVHVHHGIRGQSADEDQRYVEELCRSYGVELICEQINVPELARELGVSTELAGRRGRREAFERALRGCAGRRRLMLAHHANDQEETILMNFLRGSGAAGLAGMRGCQSVSCEDGFSYEVIRPFLEYEHKEILEALSLRGIAWREDETNQETIYNRNSLRLEIIPAIKKLYPGFTGTAKRMGEVMADTSDYLSMLAEEFLNTNSYTEDGQLFLSVPALKKEHIALAREVIRRAVKRNGGLVDVSFSQVEEILSLLELQSGREVCIDSGRRVRRSFDAIVFGDGNAASDKECLVLEMTDEKPEDIIKFIGNRTRNRCINWFDCDKICRITESEIVVRRPLEGDYLIIDHEGHRKKLSTYLKQQKIDAYKRNSIWVAAAGKLVLQVMGYRNSCGFEIDMDSKRILKIYSKER